MKADGETIRGAAELVGLPRSTVHAWGTRGLVGPNLVGPHGRRRYGPDDLLGLRILRDLREARGVERPARDLALSKLTEPGTVSSLPTTAWLVAAGDSVDVVYDAEALLAAVLAARPRTATLVPVGAVAADLRGDNHGGGDAG